MFGISVLQAQTCCSGGVPLAGNLGLPAAQAGSWQVGLSYDYNRLRRLYTGSKAFDETSRTRTTHTTLLEIGYSLSNRWSIDFLLPYIVQERIIQREQRTVDQTNGFGDAVLLVRYQWLNPNPEQAWQWSSGLGVKLPNGSTEKRSNFGIAYNADLQPGSGAWDLIFWNRVSHQLSFRPSLSIFLNTVHRQRGTNNDYLPFINQFTGERQAQAYRFGAETQITLGLSDRIYWLGVLMDPGVSLLMRHAGADQTNEVNTPSTGGTFLFGQASLGVIVGERWTWQIAVDAPIHTNVVGTQVAPTLRLNTGILLRLDKKKQPAGLLLTP
ncbi:MAG: hypothetical protein AAFQ37_14080 [Bacteroidota bacterium]